MGRRLASVTTDAEAEAGAEAGADIGDSAAGAGRAERAGDGRGEGAGLLHIGTHSSPAYTTTQVFSNTNVTPILQDGSKYSGSSYVTSRLTDSEDDYDADQDQISLGNVNIQCRAAREAAGSVEVHDISCNENVSSTSQKKVDRVGSMDKSIDGSVGNCFKGTRIEKNGVLVNQFLTCSFDPATLVCITCSKEHGILKGGGGGGGTGLLCSELKKFCGNTPWGGQK